MWVRSFAIEKLQKSSPGLSVPPEYVSQSLWWTWTLLAPISQNGQTYSNNSSANCLSVFEHFRGLAAERLKFPKTNTLADGLIERTWSMLDEAEWKTVHNDEQGIDRGKRSKTLNEVKLVENISKNPQSFLEISPMQKEVLLSHKLQDHAYK